MRILVLDQFAQPGGGQKCLLDLLPGFCERGWETHAAAPKDGPMLDELRQFCTSAHAIRCGPFTAGTKAVSDVVRFSRQLQGQAKLISALTFDYGIELVYVNGPRLLPAAAMA